MSDEIGDLRDRVRIVRVDLDDVLGVFTNAQADFEYLSLPVFPDVPAGYRVVAVRENFAARCFDFLIEHPSFSPVPPGCEVQVLASRWEMRRTTYKRAEEAVPA